MKRRTSKNTLQFEALEGRLLLAGGLAAEPVPGPSATVLGQSYTNTGTDIVARTYSEAGGYSFTQGLAIRVTPVATASGGTFSPNDAMNQFFHDLMNRADVQRGGSLFGGAFGTTGVGPNGTTLATATVEAQRFAWRGNNLFFAETLDSGGYQFNLAYREHIGYTSNNNNVVTAVQAADQFFGSVAAFQGDAAFPGLPTAYTTAHPGTRVASTGTTSTTTTGTTTGTASTGSTTTGTASGIGTTTGTASTGSSTTGSTTGTASTGSSTTGLSSGFGTGFGIGNANGAPLTGLGGTDTGGTGTGTAIGGINGNGGLSGLGTGIGGIDGNGGLSGLGSATGGIGDTLGNGTTGLGGGGGGLSGTGGGGGGGIGGIGGTGLGGVGLGTGLGTFGTGTNSGAFSTGTFGTGLGGFGTGLSSGGLSSGGFGTGGLGGSLGNLSGSGSGAILTSGTAP